MKLKPQDFKVDKKKGTSCMQLRFDDEETFAIQVLAKENKMKETEFVKEVLNDCLSDLAREHVRHLKDNENEF